MIGEPTRSPEGHVHPARRTPLLLLLPFVLTISGCSGDLPPCPPDAKVMEAFGVAIDTTKASPVEQLDLYVDDAQAMAGFLARPGTVYSEALDVLITRCAMLSYRLDVYAFSNPSRRIPSLAHAAVLRADFYGAARAPLSAIVDHIRSRELQDRTTVIVSDLVQTGAMQDPQGLATALQGLAAQNRHVLLLGFRSRFDGTYRTETDPRRAYEMHVTGERQGGGRPFYVLMIAPTLAEQERAREDLLLGVVPEESFASFAPAMELVTIDFDASDQRSPRMWYTYKAPQVLPGYVRERTAVAAFFEGKSVDPKISPLRLRFGYREHVPVLSHARLGYRVERVTFGSQGGRDGSRTEQLRLDFSDPTKTRTLEILYPLARPARGSWDAYRIRILPGQGNLGLPIWVREWNTNDDQGTQDREKTIHLSGFVESLVRSVTESVVASDQFLLIGRTR